MLQYEQFKNLKVSSNDVEAKISQIMEISHKNQQKIPEYHILENRNYSFLTQINNNFIQSMISNFLEHENHYGFFYFFLFAIFTS